MKNQSMEIPVELQPAWNDATQELHDASIELQKANKRYHEAVLARIALAKAVNRTTS